MSNNMCSNCLEEMPSKVTNSQINTVPHYHCKNCNSWQFGKNTEEVCFSCINNDHKND